ncbi:hypothetical protein I4U23_028990 [Adineta vaga]|nr:hypothetical protein I4U23_028990 [Adineta vaga]
MTEGGVICAGSVITDYVVIVDQWPSENSLSNIHRQTKTGGGGPFNIVKDLRAMDKNLPLSIIGLVGNDDNGHWLRNDCQSSDINIDQLHITKDETPTSYTYVITLNQLVDEHFSINVTKHYNVFYLGYITILDRLDHIVNNETVAVQVLKQAKKYGLETVIDFVSVPNEFYSKIAQFTLPYVDHLILNEIEKKRHDF